MAEAELPIASAGAIGNTDLGRHLQTSARSPDLSPRAAAPVEWWFVQGALATATAKHERLYFMVALFQVRGIDGRSTPGHMLLVHTMDGDGRNRWTTSRITEPIAETHATVARRLAVSRFGPFLSDIVMRRHLRDVTAAAHRQGIAVAPTPTRFEGSPLLVDWQDFALAQDKDAFRLTLPIGHGGATAQLSLVPASPWLCETGDKLDPGLTPPYTYQSCPRLSVGGEIGGRRVAGRAWIDRQWGAFDGWFVADGSARLLGWDWMGLSFDSGQDLLFMFHQPIGSVTPRDGYAVLFDGDSVHRVSGRVTQEPLRFWTSARTGVVYPLDRRLMLPGIGGEIEVRPLVEDQEIPVFGVPAIWEGVVRAEGRIVGKSVRGTGRLELFGHGFADTLPRYLAREIRRRFGMQANGSIVP
ncbi:MAG: hypothetical protein GY798_17395 [Hyphomicrobiales bacterium]|nr:hypothetical protein [Hyphomicrobiales bacterium]